MTLRKRTLLALAFPLLLFFAGVYLMASMVLLRSFAGIEERDARQSIARAVRVVSADLSTLRERINDRAQSDELFEFAGSGDPRYAQSILNDTTLYPEIDMVAIVDVRGRVVHQRTWGVDGQPRDTLPTEVLKLLAPGMQLNNHGPQRPIVSGLVTVGADLLAVTSRPVQPRNGKGPGHGVMLIGRRVVASSIQSRSDIRNAEIKLTTIDPEHNNELLVPRSVQQAEDAAAWWLDDTAVNVAAKNENSLVAKAVLADVFGRRAVTLSVDQLRPIYAQARLARDSFLWAIVAMATVFVALLMRTLGLVVIGPVQRLSEQVVEIGRSGDLETEVTVRGSREIEHLAEEVNRLIQAVASAKKQADEASAAKSLFLANTSHEIRTPLNGVVGALELLMRTKLDERQLRHARMAKFSCESLLQLINDILDLSKIEAQAIELESIEIDAREIVEDVAILSESRAGEKSLQIITRTHPALRVPLKGDPLRIRQVLVNLVNNATKFTEKGSITISATIDRMDSQQVVARFTVTDTGIGIAPDRVNRLFKNFSQVDASTTRKYGGTGLGLSICRQLIELMGGEIGVASEVGRGTTFWFTVPLARVSRAEGRAALTPDLRNQRLLIVCPQGELLTKALEMADAWGMRRHAVENIDNATKVMREFTAINQAFDIVIAWAGYDQDELESLADFAFKGDSANAQAASVILIGPSRLRATIDSDKLHAVGWVEEPISSSHMLDAIAEAMVFVRSPHRDEERQDSASGQHDPMPVAATTGARIMLVEDNEINQLIATELLAEYGYSVIVANHGGEAIELLRANPFDLVLMDCQMPVMDGFQATKRIRDLERTGEIRRATALAMPIVALTANALGGDRERCLDAGMDAFLTKPLDPHALVATIERFLAERGCTRRPNSSAAVEAPAQAMPQAAAPAPVAAAHAIAAAPTVAEAPLAQPAAAPSTPTPTAERPPQPEKPSAPAQVPAPIDQAPQADSAPPRLALPPLRIAPAPPVPAASQPASPAMDLPPIDAADPIFDRDGLLRRCLNRPPLAASILSKYFASVPRETCEMGDSLDASDFDRVCKLAHGLKGSSANVGAVRVQEACAQLEKAAKLKDREACTITRGRVLVELRKFRAECDKNPVHVGSGMNTPAA